VADRGRRCRLTLAQGQLLGAMFDKLTNPRRELWLSRAGAEVNVAQEMMHTTFDIIADTMLSGQGRADVSRVEQAFTDYLNTTSWAIALILLRAPRWMPYPGRRRAERARDYLRGEVAGIVSERRHGEQASADLITRLLKATDP
jgi:cytochrome P450